MMARKPSSSASHNSGADELPKMPTIGDGARDIAPFLPYPLQKDSLTPIE